MRRVLSLGVVGLLVIALLAACGKEDAKVVVYNAQHEELILDVAKAFTKETGIKVEMRNGSDLELANQLVTEGKASPADVFLTENSPGMAEVARKGLFAKLPDSVTAQIPAQFRPTDGSWTGFAARRTVLAYNTAKVTDAQLPTSLMDLAKPEWKGKVSFSPSGADFQAIVAAVLALKGEAEAKSWLQGLKDNGTAYDGNNVVLKSVNDGKSETGILYHYYWYRDQEESGDNSDHSKMHYFAAGDPGAFLSVSGAGQLKAGKNQANAKKFLEFLVGAKGQRIIADSYALEYTLNPAVQLDRAGVPPMADLAPPAVNISDLDGHQVVELMEQVGLL